MPRPPITWLHLWTANHGLHCVVKRVGEEFHDHFRITETSGKRISRLATRLLKHPGMHYDRGDLALSHHGWRLAPCSFNDVRP